MHVKRLILSGFRSYQQADVHFNPGVNFIFGPNGQGKTNLVESLIYLSKLASHRTSDEHNLIKTGSAEGLITAQIDLGGRDYLVSARLKQRGSNEYRLNKKNISGKEITKYMNLVHFTPEDLNLVRGEPTVRRSFIDEVLTKKYPAARSLLIEYERVLKQRNRILRDLGQGGSNVSSTLDIWTESLINIGTEIIFHRRNIASDLASPLQASYESVSGHEHRVGIAVRDVLQRQADVSRETTTEEKRDLYVSRETVRKEFLAELDRVQRQELARGVSLVGPHRDDLMFELKGIPVKGNASHGETWSYVVALKLAMARILAEDSLQGDPLLVMDDVFAELDVDRRNNLYRLVREYEQVMITAAVREEVPVEDDAHVYRVVNSEIENVK